MKRLLALTLALLLLFSACTLSIPDPVPVDSPDFEIRFLDVGQADAALIRSDGETMLIDGGNREDGSLIAAVLKRLGITTLDYVVCSHAHEDHVGGLSAAFHVAAVETVLIPVTEYDSTVFSNFINAAQNSEILVPSPGDTFPLGQATVTVLGPVADYEEPNDTSLVLKVTLGETSFLFTGDMERTAEADLLDTWSDSALNATVLKVGHHGSDTSTSYPFLRAVNPTYGIISVGKGNSYGHPCDEILSRLRDANVTLYRTDLQGDIIVTSDGSDVFFQTDRNTAANANPTASVQAKEYIGNKKSKTFHLPTCASLPTEKNRVSFSTRDAALDAGFTPCKNCDA